MIDMGEDWSHTDRMRTLLKSMHQACQLKQVEYPFKDILTPEMIDGLSGVPLEEALVSVALPGKLVATGGEENKVLEQLVTDPKTGKSSIRVIFHDRRHAVVFSMEAIERAIIKIRSY
jgi:hypothetical protein